MAFSKEKTLWYLTEDGWVPGDTHYDTGGIQRHEAPNEYVALVEYKEVYSSPFDKNPTKGAAIVEMNDEEKYNQLIKIYGNCPELI